MTTWRAVGCAGASGALVYLAYPPIGAWPLGFVALVPLAAALEGRSAARALGLGLVAGMVFAIPGFHWLLGSLGPLTGASLAVRTGLWLGLCVIQAGSLGSFAALYAVARNRGWRLGPALVIAFSVAEHWHPTVVPTYLGVVVHDVVPLIQVAELAGPGGVSVILLLSNAVIARVLVEPGLGPRGRRQAVATAFAVPAAAALLGSLRVAAIRAELSSRPGSVVAIVQANFAPRAARVDAGQVLGRHVRLTWEARQRFSPELVVWSETVVTRPVPALGSAKYLRRRFADVVGVPTLFGAIATDPAGGSRNAAFLTDEHGELLGRYDKNILAPIGEYLPFEAALPRIRDLFPKAGVLEPGRTAKTIRWGARRLAVSICYEDLFPGYVNEMVRRGPVDALVNLTNDGWFDGTIEPALHLAHARFRAVEHRLFLIRATNTGISAVIDPTGRLVAVAPASVDTILGAKVVFGGGGTVYELVGDAPWWLATLALGCMVGCRRRHGSGAWIRSAISCHSPSDSSLG